MCFEHQSVVLFKRRSVQRVRLLTTIPRFLFSLSMLCCLANVGCKVDPFKYLDKNDVLALTPDKIVIAPTNTSTTTTAMGTTQVQMSGGSMDVAVFGAAKTGEPREYRHVYVCLGKCPEKDSDSESDSSNPGLESAYSKWVQLLATSAEDGRGCRNVSSEILHCILRSDGTAKFKVVTSGAIYPFAKPIPIHAHSGDANSKGNIWISYGFPDDTKLDLILPAGKQFSVLESSPTNQSICGTTLPCDSIRRALPYSLRLLTKEDMDSDTNTEPGSEDEPEADTDTEPNQERWISVPLDVPVLAQVNAKLSTTDSELSQEDASSVKIWLSKDSLCSASGLAVQTSQVLAFDQSTAASDTGYVCINGLGGKIDLSANVVDYGPSENTILRAEERLSAKPRPAGLSFQYSLNADDDTDLSDAGPGAGDLSLTMSNCLNEPLDGLGVTFSAVNVEPIVCENTEEDIEGNREEDLQCVSNSKGIIKANITPISNTGDWEIRATVAETGDECSIRSSQAGGSK